MPLRVRFQYSQGASLGYSIERLSDGANYDFNDGTFKSTAPTTQISSLVAGTGNRAGVYGATLASTPASQFSNGDYAIYINNVTASNAVIGLVASSMYNGDDVTPVATGGGGADPWATLLPGAYPTGSAGALLATNLDAKVSTRSTFAGGVVAGVTAPVTVGANNDKAGYSLAAADHSQILSEINGAVAPVKAVTDRIQFDPTNLVLTTSSGAASQPTWYNAPPTVQQIRQELDANSTKLANLDAKVSTRSTFAGGVVAGVTAPVTVGANNDKAGYSLAAADHSQILSEINGAVAPVKAVTDRIQFDPTNLVLTTSSGAASQPAWYNAPPTVLQIRQELDANSTKLANLDAAVSSRPTAVQIRTELDANSTKLVNLDAKVSTRSTFAGGIVAGVTAPVTVGANNDKAGYSLAAADHSQILSEINGAVAPVKAVTDRIQFDPTNLVLTTSSGAASQPAWYNAPPTVLQIRQELDANSTKLANLDAAVSSRPTAVQIRTELDANSTKLVNLDAKVSTRSTFAGGIVAGVTAPVTVGANNDKAGYSLAASGLDAVMIEPTVNARQALVPILAAASGVISGAGTGSIIIKGGNSTTNRITATTDSTGNRTSVVLTLPN